MYNEKLKKRREEEEEEEEEIEADFNLLQFDNARIINEIKSIKEHYQSIIKQIYTMVCIIVMLISLCNLCKYHILYSTLFMIAFTLLHLKHYVLSLIYQALNIPPPPRITK